MRALLLVLLAISTVAGDPVVHSQPVTFSHDGVTLHGTLFWPDSSARVPAVVAFHDASIGNADAALYRHLRDGLPGIGVAVLLFDRRSDASSVGFETLAGDGIAGARAIARLPQIDASCIGYWGISQGGWLSLMAGVRDPAAAFAIAVSAPLVTPAAQMEYAMANRLRVLGYPESDVNAMLAARRAWTQYLRGSLPLADAVAAIEAIDTKPWFKLMYMPTGESLAAGTASNSFRLHMDVDPLKELGNLRVPTLLIYGGADLWTPVQLTVDRLRGLAATHPSVTYAVIPGASHELMFLTNDTMPTDARTLSTFSPQAPEYFMLLGSWLTRNTERCRR